ncbi:N-acetylmuramoyl-L-alanine amidase [Stackebrandtia soli]|uniref:N-acetylmuramoyl-L-alanine amidase n=1 Tax=Stackebrandtia soli TaxID=1892856 RepID=UPI0039EA1874
MSPALLTAPARPPRNRAAILLLFAALTVVSACDNDTPPTPKSTAVAAQEQDGPLTGVTIVIDPGHNGGNVDHPELINEQVDVANGKKACDTTGTTTDDGYAEHAFNFDVATRLAESLREAGATVVTTRPDDSGVGPCITERTAVANDLEADVAISIHADGGPDDGRGFHIMEPVAISGHNEDVVAPSHELALDLADAIAAETDMPASDYIGDEGINPRSDMGGLNLTTVPKVMVECGNMRNHDDAALLSDPDFRQSLADALDVGIRQYLAD